MNRAVGLLTVATLVSMAAGFAREAAVAARFGTTGDADALAVAMFYVDGVAAVAVVGIAGVLMVPVIARITQERGREAAFRLMDCCLLWAAILTMPLALATLLGPERVAQVLVPEFSHDRRVALAQLLIFTLPTMMLLVLSGVMAGLLQAERDYFTPVNGRAVFALTTAAAVLLFPGVGTAAAGVGLLGGACLLAAVHVRGLWRLGWRLSMPRLRQPGLGHAVRVAVPTLLALVLINVLMGGLQRMAASGLPEGGLSAMNYALRALNIVSGLTISLATVSLTELSLRYEAEGMGPAVVGVLTDALESGVWVLVPMTLLLVAASEPLVALLFHRGEYDVRAIHLTAQCLRWLAGAIVPGMVVAIILRAAPAFGRPWRSVGISVAWTTATVAATVSLIPVLGAAALAAGHTVGVSLAAGISFFALIDLVPLSAYRSLIAYAARIAALSALGWLGAEAAARWFPGSSYGAVESVLRLLVIASAFLVPTIGLALFTGEIRTRAVFVALLKSRPQAGR